MSDVAAAAVISVAFLAGALGYTHPLWECTLLAQGLREHGYLVHPDEDVRRRWWGRGRS